MDLGAGTVIYSGKVFNDQKLCSRKEISIELADAASHPSQKVFTFYLFSLVHYIISLSAYIRYDLLGFSCV